MPRPPRETGGSTIGGGLFYGHREDFTSYDSDSSDSLDKHYYNKVVLRDGLLRITVKVILAIVLIYLIVRVLR